MRASRQASTRLLSALVEPMGSEPAFYLRPYRSAFRQFIEPVNNISNDIDVPVLIVGGGPVGLLERSFWTAAKFACSLAEKHASAPRRAEGPCSQSAFA